MIGIICSAANFARSDNPHCGSIVPSTVYDCAKAATILFGVAADVDGLELRQPQAVDRRDVLATSTVEVEWWPSNGVMLGVSQRVVVDSPAVYARPVNAPHQLSGFDNLEIEAKWMLDNAYRTKGIDVRVHLATSANTVARDQAGADLIAMWVVKYHGARLFLTPELRLNPSSLGGETDAAHVAVTIGGELRGDEWRLVGDVGADQEYISSLRREGSFGTHSGIQLSHDWARGVAVGAFIEGFNMRSTVDADPTHWGGSIGLYLRGTQR